MDQILVLQKHFGISKGGRLIVSLFKQRGDLINWYYFSNVIAIRQPFPLNTSEAFL